MIGRYIVDFYCAAPRTAIELDGSQHYSDEGVQKDAERDTFLQQEGITVLRYTNLDVARHFDTVCADILTHLGLAHLLP